MKDKYVVFELNEPEDSYEQLTYPLEKEEAKKYLDKACTWPGASYMIAKVTEYKHVPKVTSE